MAEQILGKQLSRGRPKNFAKSRNRVLSVHFKAKARFFIERIKNVSGNTIFLHEICSNAIIQRFPEYEKSYLLWKLQQTAEKRDKLEDEMQEILNQIKEIDSIKKQTESEEILRGEGYA